MSVFSLVTLGTGDGALVKNIFFLDSFTGSSFLISFGFALKNSIFPPALDFSLGLSTPGTESLIDGFVSGTAGCFDFDGPATGMAGCLLSFKFFIFWFISRRVRLARVGCLP